MWGFLSFFLSIFSFISGKSLQTTSNYLRLKVEEGKGVYEYEVRFDPRVDSRNERFRLIGQQVALIGPTKVRIKDNRAYDVAH